MRLIDYLWLAALGMVAFGGLISLFAPIDGSGENQEGIGCGVILVGIVFIAVLLFIPASWKASA